MRKLKKRNARLIHSTSVTMASYALGAPCHDPEILPHGAGIDAPEICIGFVV
jgi:hypothetical protein